MYYPTSIRFAASLLPVLAALLTLAGCQSDSEAPAGVPLGVPGPIAKVRAIDQSNLQPYVQSGNGPRQPLTQISDNQWQLTIDVPANSQVNLLVEWFERDVPGSETTPITIPEEGLLLARQSETVVVGDQGGNIVFDDDGYDTTDFLGLDLDGDLFSNLAERNAGTDPFDPTKKPAGPGDVQPGGGDGGGNGPGGDGPEILLTVEESTPAAIAAVTQVDRDQLQAYVSIDGAPLQPMPRVATDRWRQSTTLVGDRELVLVAEWYEQNVPGSANSVVPVPAEGLLLARAEQSFTVGSTALTVSFDTYITNSAAQDLDGDGASNLAERRANTSPFDSRDIPVNGGDVEGTGNPAPDNNVRALIVPAIDEDDAPIIDGRGVTELDAAGNLVGEWAAAVQSDANGNRLFIDKLMIDQGADGPNGSPWRRWAALHDGRFLYVLVLSDEGPGRPRIPRYSDSELFYDDDTLELFFDGDNSKQEQYGADDFHFLMPLSPSDTDLSNGTVASPFGNRFQRGPNSSRQSIDVSFATLPDGGPRGVRAPRFEQDVYEVRIDLEDANIRIGQPFGFEVQIDDDDDGGARDSKWGWAHPPRTTVDIDLTVDNPSYMGTLILQN